MRAFIQLKSTSLGAAKSDRLRSVRCELLLALACVLVPKLCSAEDLLIIDIFARVTPVGQSEPVPDPFVESILRGETPQTSQDVLQLPAKSFQISARPQDFESDFGGVQGQRVAVAFTALVLPSRVCAVTNYRAIGLARASRNQLIVPGSSEVVSRGGFTITPSQRVLQSVTARYEGGTVTYYLIFSAANGLAQ